MGSPTPSSLSWPSPASSGSAHTWTGSYTLEWGGFFPHTARVLTLFWLSPRSTQGRHSGQGTDWLRHRSSLGAHHKPAQTPWAESGKAGWVPHDK